MKYVLFYQERGIWKAVQIAFDSYKDALDYAKLHGYRQNRIISEDTYHKLMEEQHQVQESRPTYSTGSIIPKVRTPLFRPPTVRPAFVGRKKRFDDES